MPEEDPVPGTKTINLVTIAISLGIVVLICQVMFIPIIWNEISSTWEQLDRELQDVEDTRNILKETLKQIPIYPTRQAREIVRRRLGDEGFATSKKKNRTIVRRRRIHRKRPDWLQTQRNAAFGARNVNDDGLLDVNEPSPRKQCSCSSHNTCPRGPQGPPGLRGDDGIPGEQGIAGITGMDSIDVTVQIVSTGCTMCPAGQDGPPGVDGPIGLPGLSGAPGIAGLPGRNGAPGYPGDIGPPGKPGKRGKSGVEGHPGVNGMKSTGTPGPKGPVGPQGPPGERGDDGDANDEEGAPGPQGEPGEPEFPGDEGDRGEPGPQGIPGEKGAARMECGCRELLLRKISITNNSLSQRHRPLQPLENEHQEKHLKEVLDELEPIKIRNQEFEKHAGTFPVESSGDELIADEQESLTTPSLGQDPSTNIPRFVEKDDLELLTEALPDEKLVSKGVQNEDITDSVRASARKTTIEEPYVKTTTTAKTMISSSTSEEFLTSRIPVTARTWTTTERSSTIGAIGEEFPLQTKDQQMYESFVMHPHKDKHFPTRHLSRRPSNRLPYRMWRLPAPPHHPPRTRVLGRTVPNFDEENDNFEKPTHRYVSSAEEQESRKSSPVERQTHPVTRTVDIRQILAARERARQQMLHEKRAKTRNERIERMRNRIVETLSYEALEKAIDRVKTPNMPIRLNSASSSPPEEYSGFSVLNMSPTRAVWRQTPRRSRSRQRVHAAGSFEKFQKKELILPPVEEFAADEQLQMRAYAIENELRNVAQQKAGNSQSLRREDMDQKSEENRSKELVAPGVIISLPQARESAKILENGVLLRGTEAKTSPHIRFVGATATAIPRDPMQSLEKEKTTVFENEENEIKRNKGKIYVRNGGENIYGDKQLLEKDIVKAKRRNEMKFSKKEQAKKQNNLEVHRRKQINNVEIVEKSAVGRNALQQEKRENNGNIRQTSERSDAADEEGGEAVEADNVFARPSNMHEREGHSSHRADIFQETEIEDSTPSNGNVKENKEKIATEKREYIGLVDHVAYSPLTDARAVISDPYSSNVRTVRVRSSGAKQVPISEMMIDTEVSEHPKLTNGLAVGESVGSSSDSSTDRRTVHHSTDITENSQGRDPNPTSGRHRNAGPTVGAQEVDQRAEISPSILDSKTKGKEEQLAKTWRVSDSRKDQPLVVT